jgi:hypothetical protein
LARKLRKVLEKISPMFASRATRASVVSISAVLCTGASVTSMPSDRAAASTARKNSLCCCSSGLKTYATRVIEGAICLMRSAHLPPIENSGLAKPVMLPPGCARFGTKPCSPGSETLRNTIGIVLVARCKVARFTLDSLSTTSGLNKPTRSVA